MDLLCLRCIHFLILKHKGFRIPDKLMKKILIIIILNLIYKTCSIKRAENLQFINYVSLLIKINPLHSI